MRKLQLLMVAMIGCASLTSMGQTAAGSPKDYGPDGPKTDAMVQAEADEADKLLKGMNFEEACPLIDDLLKQRPRNGVYHSGKGQCLGYKAARAKTPEEKVKWMEAERTEFRTARALGYDGGLVRIALESLGDKPFDPKGYAPKKNETEAEVFFHRGEAMFGQQRMEEAFELYKKAYEADPKFYAAALYAGDASFNGNKLDRAAEWFAKAIAIDPNGETAYRYWGDALLKQGKQKEAREKFIDAVIANPYTNRSWVGLERFGQQTGIKVSAPHITLPAGPTEGKPGKDGKSSTNITIDPAMLNGPSGAVWMMYPMERALWRQENTRAIRAKLSGGPMVTGPYRHSLWEEAAAIRMVLKVAKEKKVGLDQMDANLRQLAELEGDGVLEAWIVLNHADQDIAKDYSMYREGHRAALRKYIEKYVLHAA